MYQFLIADVPPNAPSGAPPGFPGLAGAEIAAMPGPEIRVLIADDHPFVRSGIKQCINDSDGMQVVGEAGSAAEVFGFLSRSSCDVLVLDIGLPDQSGLEVLRLLKLSHPALPVLILTMYPEDQYAAHCMRAGAAGFLSKSNASNYLVDAIRKATRNGRKPSQA
jgi:two-component system invasion response regulator UvrY